MNIHFTDKKLFESLKENSLIRLTVGSHAYGTDNENSDIDYLYIYIKPKSLQNSFLYEHHQLQYKEDGIDHNFTDLQSFVRNIMTGDSTINFEALHDPELGKNEALRFLYDRRFDFYGYNIIKSYLGLARRDLKKCWSLKKGVDRFIYNTDKLYHAMRGYHTAVMINDMFPYENDFSKFNKELYNKLVDVKNSNSNFDFDELQQDYNYKIFNERKCINQKLEISKIDRVMNIKRMASLDTLIRSTVDTYQTDFYLPRKSFYGALENGIKY